MTLIKKAKSFKKCISIFRALNFLFKILKHIKYQKVLRKTVY